MFGLPAGNSMIRFGQGRALCDVFVREPKTPEAEKPSTKVGYTFKK